MFGAIAIEVAVGNADGLILTGSAKSLSNWGAWLRAAKLAPQ